MFIIGICGASCSGKTTLAQEIEKAFPGRCVTLAQDAYYCDHSNLSFEERETVNYDAPDAFDNALLLQDLSALRSGKSITRKGYDYSLHCRADRNEIIAPCDLLILEGIHVFSDKAVREMMDLRLFVDVDPDECLIRRVERDMVNRGRDLPGIFRQYRESVKPMLDQYIRAYGQYADLIVPDSKNPRMLKVLTDSIRKELEK